ncbi:MAG: hypothetical protein Q9P14_03225 [candidate division KSB1 bacterium]|nr:hypothetical protein [candidate division KSB1 bacterium]MDQ7064232.1 hypothetical protein [candidate division KSB1 bacterium]
MWIWTPVFEFPVSSKDRPDAHLDAVNNRVFIFFSSKSTSRLYKLQYDPNTGNWTEISNHTVPEVLSVADNPASFVRALNGDLWAFMVTSGQVIGVKSTDEGATWSSRITILNALNSTSGLTDAVAFTDTGGVTSIALGVAENAGASSQFYFLLHRDGAADTDWIDESSNLTPINGEGADDHLAMTVDENNNVYMITKTTGGGSTVPENTLYIMGKAVTVCDTSIENTRKGLEKPNQHKVFYHDSKWWMIAKKATTNQWNLWRFAGGITWISVYEFTVSSKDNPDLHIDNANNKLYVFFSGKSGSSSLWTMSYNVIAENWTKIGEVAVPVVRTVADNPASFTIAKNGDYWSFMASDTQLVAVRSSDQGATWSSTIVIKDTLYSSYGITDAVPFTDNKGVNWVALALAENANTNSKFGFFLHRDGDPDTVWVDESNNVTMFGVERSDDHINLAVDSNNNVYMVVKTTGGGAGSPENSLYKRMPDSTWQKYILIDGNDWTRPAIVIDESHDSLYVFGTRETASIGKVVEYKRCKIGEENTLETATRVAVIDNGLDDFLNVAVPAMAVYDSTELMLIADNVDSSNVWFRQLSIGTPVPCPSIGRWRSYAVVDGDGWTRPGIVIDDQHDSLYVFGTRETASIGKVIQYKRCQLGEEWYLESESPVTVIDHGTDDFLNLSLPGHAVHDTTELMVITANQDSNDVWFTRIDIGNAAGCITAFDTTINNLTIMQAGNGVQLKWNAVAFADSYVVYRGYNPMFSPDTARLASTTDTTYTDANVLGDPNVNHFYVVRAYVNGSPGPPSTRVGEFEYELISPPGKTNNFVALCLRDPGINMASDFVTRIGPTVDLVSKWTESAQAWGSYIPGLAFTDFAVEVNEVYMISVTAQDTLLLLGEVPTGHQYVLITTASGKNNNGMMVLMDTDTLTLASELANAIGPVDLVSKWTATAQAYGSYITGLPFTDFTISFGMPLMVSVTQDTTWPKR